MPDYNSAYTGAQIDSAVAAVLTNGSAWSGKASKPLALGSYTIPPSAWTADSTYTKYAFRAAVPFEGITANHYCRVTFDPDCADIENLGIVCDTGSNVVYVYAKERPASAVNVLGIIAEEVSAV